jgi:hypothetical protein
MSEKEAGNIKSKYEAGYVDIQSVCEIELRRIWPARPVRSGEKEDVNGLVMPCGPEAHKFPL